MFNQSHEFTRTHDSDFLMQVAFFEDVTKQKIQNKDWNKYFENTKLTQTDVWNMASRMNNKKEHEQLVRFLKAALINGHSQPWMYEVLAISMEITKQPQEDIERVLLSLSDFTPRDVPSLLVSAAYLVRFKAYKQALKMYQQASRLAPEQPEPYALGLKLAKSENDKNAILWAAGGILTKDWGTGYQKRHREAEGTILNLIQKANQNKDTKAAKFYKQELNRLLQRDLILKLEWSGNADFDMAVEEPNGQVCSFRNRRTTGGGVHVFNGAGPSPERCFEEYVCPKGLSGYYRIRIQHLAGNVVGNRVSLKVTRYKGTPDEEEKTIRIPLNKKEKIFKISLHQGRREKLGAIPQKISIRDPKTRAVSFKEFKQNYVLNQIGQTNQVTGAVGFQSVVSNISEGASLSGAVTISADRRYVRINMQPIFSNITDVFTFSFASGGN